MHFHTSFLLIGVTSLILACNAWDVASPKGDDNQCAQIFLHSGYQGPFLDVKDEEQFFDLSDLWYYMRKESSSRNEDPQNSTNFEKNWSFKVKQGCSLKLSTETYLKGEVQEFSADEKTLLLTPKSLACECPKFCRCEDHRLRKSECGRAYLNDDCSNCKAPFTTLTPGDGHWKNFPEKWSAQVKTIVVRSGCNVRIQTAEGGELEVNSTQRVARDIESLGHIASYSCVCSNHENHKATGSELNSSNGSNAKYPQLLNIPRTKGGINTLLFSEEFRQHPGLLSSLQSLRHRRSSRNAYILLLGLTGSGKSSAVNLLFDHPNITKVGDFVSTTTDILQFTIPISIPELGMNNTALHVIDTPGICDTRGVSHDAQFLATLEDFLHKHEDLKRRLPNVVLIFSKFSDNRFYGEGAPFVKMLRTIDLFKDKIIDKKSTNVIFVLTHYMSETKKITKDPRQHVQKIREVIEEFSTLPRPINIILAENKPEESQLPSINGFWKLPNGEFYPKNLFDQMQRNLVNNEDPVGEVIIRTAFSNSDNFNITGKRQPLLRPSNAKVIRYLSVLASFSKPVSGTEISGELDQAYELVEPETKERYPDVLNLLQRKLFQKNILRIEDLPRTSLEIMKLLEEIQLNPLTLSLMEHAFNITIPEFKRDLVVGSGYSLVHDCTLPAKIFDLGQSENIPSDILYRVPDAYQIEIAHRLDNQIHVFTDRDSYIAGRMKALGLAEDVFPKNSYSSSPSNYPGFNLISFNNDTNWNSITATVDYHIFQISLTEKAHFSNTFLDAISSLEKYNATDEVNVRHWENFFDIYGTHVVSRAFGGGSIEVKVEIEEENQVLSIDNTQKLAVLSDAMSNIVEQLSNELIGKDTAYVPPPGVKYSFTQSGGLREHYWSNFSEADETRNIDEWRDSLKYDPVVLKSRLYLVPISEVVKELGGNEELGYMIEEAAAKLLNASLIFIPVGRMGGEGPNSRDNLDNGIGRGDFQAMQQFSEMFKMISMANKEMQQQVFTVMAELKAKRDAQEMQYQEKLLELKKYQADQERQMREDERYRYEMEFKKKQLENERLVQESALHLQLEKQRFEAELNQKTMLEQIRAQQQAQMLQIINSENERATQIMIAKMNQKSWWERAIDTVTGFFGAQAQTAAALAPVLGTMG